MIHHLDIVELVKDRSQMSKEIADLSRKKTLLRLGKSKNNCSLLMARRQNQSSGLLLEKQLYTPFGFLSTSQYDLKLTTMQY
jgi:hypothetical protein